MIFMITLLLASSCLAAPQYSYDDSDEYIEILHDSREHYGDGSYRFDFETENGIKWQENGSPEGSDEAVHVTGEYSYPMEDGGTFYLSYIADDTGFHPSSPYLPVAPEFPHELPQWVLDQIEKARIEDLNRSGSSEGYYS